MVLGFAFEYAQGSSAEPRPWYESVRDGQYDGGRFASGDPFARSAEFAHLDLNGVLPPADPVAVCAAAATDLWAEVRNADAKSMRYRRGEAQDTTVCVLPTPAKWLTRPGQSSGADLLVPSHNVIVVASATTTAEIAEPIRRVTAANPSPADLTERSASGSHWASEAAGDRGMVASAADPW